MAGPGLFINTQGASVTVWETGAQTFDPSPGLTPCIATPQYYFHGRGDLAPREGRREWARAQQLFQCVNP